MFSWSRHMLTSKNSMRQLSVMVIFTLLDVNCHGNAWQHLVSSVACYIGRMTIQVIRWRLFFLLKVQVCKYKYTHTSHPVYAIVFFRYSVINECVRGPNTFWICKMCSAGAAYCSTGMCLASVGCSLVFWHAGWNGDGITIWSNLIITALIVKAPALGDQSPAIKPPLSYQLPGWQINKGLNIRLKYQIGIIQQNKSVRVIWPKPLINKWWHAV